MSAAAVVAKVEVEVRRQPRHPPTPISRRQDMETIQEASSNTPVALLLQKVALWTEAIAALTQMIASFARPA